MAAGGGLEGKAGEQAAPAGARTGRVGGGGGGGEEEPPPAMISSVKVKTQGSLCQGSQQQRQDARYDAAAAPAASLNLCADGQP